MDNGMYDYPYLGKARRIWIWMIKGLFFTHIYRFLEDE